MTDNDSLSVSSDGKEYDGIMNRLKNIKSRHKLVSVLLVAVVVVVLLIIIVRFRTGKIETVSGISSPDMSDHPIYSKYEFGEAANIIDIGIQPLEIPPGVISEAMRRDTVLEDALSELGLEARFHPFLKGADINFFLRRGDMEAVFAGDMPTVTAAATLDVVVVTLTKMGFNSIVAREHMLLKNLRGKRIAYAFGSNAHYSLLEALANAGLTENDVRLVPLDMIEMSDALARKEIDAFSAWEPTPAAALARSDDFVTINRTLSTSYMYFARSFAEKHPEAARQIMASQLRSMTWMQRQRQNLLQACRWALQAGEGLSGEKPTLSAEQYAALAQRDILDFMSVPMIPGNSLAPGRSLHREFEFLKDLGRIPPSSDWDSARGSFDSKIINEIMANSRKYALDKYHYDIDGGSDE